jgi:tetratricopeptide (TPR) repeat protein
MKHLLATLLILLSSITAAFGQSAEAYYNKGNEKSASGDFKGAIADYSEAIKLSPDLVSAWYNRGTAKANTGDMKGAIKDFDKAISLKPDYFSAYKNRGSAKMKSDNIDGALVDFDAAIRLDPTAASVWFMRGQVKLQQGHTAGGCSDLVKALDLGDKRAQTYINQYCGGQPTGKKTGNIANEAFILDWPNDEGWKVANQNEDKERKVVELLRNNETFDNWTEIGTMMIYPSLKNVPVDAAMNAMFEQAKKSCPDAKLTFIEKDDKIKYPWIIFTIECTSGPESQVWHVMQGSNELYVCFRAVKQKTVPNELKNKWTAFFKTAKIATE